MQREKERVVSRFRNFEIRDISKTAWSLYRGGKTERASSMDLWENSCVWVDAGNVWYLISWNNIARYYATVYIETWNNISEFVISFV